jgi:hypothetical protein
MSGLRRFLPIVVSLVAAHAHAGPATPPAKVSTKMTCVSSQSGQLVKSSLSKADIIASVLDIPPDQAGAFDLVLLRPSPEIDVVRRCDGGVVAQVFVSACTESELATKYAVVCHGGLADWKGPVASGEVHCRLTGKVDGFTVLTSSGQCRGTIEYNGSSCDFSARVSGNFKPTGNCP